MHAITRTLERMFARTKPQANEERHQRTARQLRRPHSTQQRVAITHSILQWQRTFAVTLQAPSGDRNTFHATGTRGKTKTIAKNWNQTWTTNTTRRATSGRPGVSREPISLLLGRRRRKRRKKRSRKTEESQARRKGTWIKERYR